MNSFLILLQLTFNHIVISQVITFATSLAMVIKQGLFPSNPFHSLIIYIFH